MRISFLEGGCCKCSKKIRAEEVCVGTLRKESILVLSERFYKNLGACLKVGKDHHTVWLVG